MMALLAVSLVVAFVSIIAVADSLDRRTLLRLQAKTNPTDRDLKRIAFLQTQVDMTPAKSAEEFMQKKTQPRRCSRQRNNIKK